MTETMIETKKMMISKKKMNRMHQCESSMQLHRLNSNKMQKNLHKKQEIHLLVWYINLTGMVFTAVFDCCDEHAFCYFIIRLYSEFVFFFY